MINYYLLTKPGIVLGNILTLAAGFLLASKGEIEGRLFIATLLGLALIMAAGCVFNNYIDRPLDKKMKRTQNRALVQEQISGRNALWFGTVLSFLGGALLFFLTNFLALVIAGIGFFVYVVLYSFWKGHTIYGTAIGSVAGAVPPVVGYSAASNSLDLGAVILFIMLVCWQMPHFFSVALVHLEDYKAAEIPVLPIKKGLFRTKVHMIVYIAAFICAASSLTIFGYTGYLYLFAVASMSLMWLLSCAVGFQRDEETRWGRKMFRYSLATIAVTCLVLPFDLNV